MKNRILFATDVPFWQASTGAEQRILAMHRFLESQGHDCAVFFLGEISPVEKEQVASHSIQLFESSSQRPPEKLLNRVKWYADATINQARNWLYQSRIDGTDADGPPSLILDDFKWPWAITRFAEVVDQFMPTAIIVEYIKMAYLLQGLSEKQCASVTTLIDTHDVLHMRAEQFFAHGFPHWLRIDKEEEAAVLRKFDNVIAIQDQEAATFREMVGDQANVITVGHAVESETIHSLDYRSQNPAERITVGYIGSKNFSNWQAIREFLNCAWPAVLHKHDATCNLIIAGGICDWFDKDDDGNPIALEHPNPKSADSVAQFEAHALKNVKLLGRIDRIEEFYDQIDVVINPVQFGTGLKIKNAESLRFGKLLITTTNGFNGMPEATRLACMVVETVNEMGLAINSICNDLSAIRPMQKLALQLSQTEFSESQAYQALSRCLELR